MKRIVILCCIALLLLAGCRTEPEAVTLAQYEQLQTGMTYDQVKHILGRGGVAVPNAGGTANLGMAMVAFKTYEWRNADDSFINAVFLSGQMTEKSQYRLQ